MWNVCEQILAQFFLEKKEVVAESRSSSIDIEQIYLDKLLLDYLQL